MNKTAFLISVQAYLCLFLLLFVGVETGQPRIYDNPLNSKSVDLFIVADGSNSYMNVISFGQMKLAIENIVSPLNLAGSSAYIGVYFFGAASAIQNPVTFPTSPGYVTANLDRQPFITTQPNPSTLNLALNSVDASCRPSCRLNTPRVTVVLSSAPDHLAEARIRQLESQLSMTVIVVGIGLSANTAVLNRLASHPSRYYAVPFDSFTTLLVSAKYISSLITDVPRSLDVGKSLSVSSTLSGVYYTVQLDTSTYTSTNNTIVAFTTSCWLCSVYASLSEPNPTSVNGVRSTTFQSFYGPNLHNIHFFLIPQNARRFFLSFLGNGMYSVTGRFDTFYLPQMMQIMTKNDLPSDLAELIG